MRDIVRLKIERELVRIKIDDTNAFSNEIGVNVGVSKLMLPSINLLLPVLVSAARHILTTVRHKLMLPGITYYYWLWETAKAKTINGERQIQALVDKKKVIITEMSVRSDLKFEDARSDIITQPSSSKPQKKQSRRKQRKRSGPTEPIPNEATIEEHIPTHSNDPLLVACSSTEKFSKSLKQRVKKLEKKKKSRPHGLSRLYKVGSSRRVESSKGSLGAQEDASKQRRKIADLDADEEPIVNAATTTSSIPVSAAGLVTTVGEVVTTASVEVTTTSATITVDELTLAQTLIEIKAAKPKALDEELEFRMHAEEQAELERMQREIIAQEEASRATINEELDRIQAMIEADEQLTARLQVEEQEQFSIEEKSRMLVEMIAERKKFFAAQRAAEQRSNHLPKLR
ncbi:hypothetical protein Tco_0698392 [Tanacetum coccineum]